MPSTRNAVRILLVADDPRFARALESRLRGRGCNVTHVSTARDCFSRAERLCPDVILLGARVGRASGLATCDRIKRDARLRCIPLVLIVDEMHGGVLRHRASQTRADVYVQKNEGLVANRVEQMITPLLRTRSGTMRQPRRPPPPPRQSDVVAAKRDAGPRAESARDAAVQRAEAAEQRVADLENQLERLAATALRLHTQLRAADAERKAEPVTPPVARSREREQLAKLAAKLPPNPKVRTFVDRLEKAHAVERMDDERRHREEIEHVEDELAAAQAEIDRCTRDNEALRSQLENRAPDSTVAMAS